MSNYFIISCDLVRVNITLVLCVVCVSLLNTDSLAQYSHCIDIFDVAGFTLKLSFLTQLGFPYIHTNIKATCKRYHFDVATIWILVSLLMKFQKIMCKAQTVLPKMSQSQLFKTIVRFTSIFMTKR